ncbi:hypothetical protein NKH85_14775 [Mesorhizobium sp. M0924]|uniref:hypothetical protein n=1 Tax=unclassified Mesorhizobium TaxID=325217 RepID=UPI0033391855
MPYRIKRILLKTGEILTERTLLGGGILVDEEAPVVGDIVETTVRGQPMKVEIIWGHWADRRSSNPDMIVPLRAKEV